MGNHPSTFLTAAGHGNRRLFPRRSLAVEVCLDTTDGVVAGRLRDLAPGGVLIETPVPLPTATELEIRVSESDWMGEHRLHGRVVRCDTRAGEGEAICLVACEIPDANDRWLMDALHLVHGAGNQASGAGDG